MTNTFTWFFENVKGGTIRVTGGEIVSGSKGVFAVDGMSKLIISGGKVECTNANGVAAVYCPYGRTSKIKVDENCIFSKCEKVVYERLVNEIPFQ